MASHSRVAVVTGSNKGIGLACIRQLALQYPQSGFNNGPLLIYLTARSKERGEEAVRVISADQQLKAAKTLRAQSGLTEVQYLPLDIDRRESIAAFCDLIRRKHPDGIDFVINNAGIAMEGFDSGVVKGTLNCNYYGTLLANRGLLPQIRDGGRLVNIASSAGHLAGKYSADIRDRFLGAQKTDDITALMVEFAAAVEAGSYQSQWPGAAYAVSKCGVIGMTRTQAWELRDGGSKTLVNSCCPGWVATEMTKGKGYKTVDEGAMTPVLLALGDIKGSNGEFWQHERIIQW